jgi:membrane protein DedA with SNARE-associated domain
MPWRVFVAYNIAGAFLWAVVITLLGFVFGQSLPLLVKWVGRTGTILLIAIVIIIAIVWRIKRRDK